MALAAAYVQMLAIWPGVFDVQRLVDALIAHTDRTSKGRQVSYFAWAHLYIRTRFFGCRQKSRQVTRDEAVIQQEETIQASSLVDMARSFAVILG